MDVTSIDANNYSIDYCLISAKRGVKNESNYIINIDILFNSYANYRVDYVSSIARLIRLFFRRSETRAGCGSAKCGGFRYERMVITRASRCYICFWIW